MVNPLTPPAGGGSFRPLKQSRSGYPPQSAPVGASGAVGSPQSRGGGLPNSPAKPLPGAPGTAGSASATNTAQGGYAAAPGMPGANDPAYLAYMRQMGVDESNLNILLGHRQSALVRELGRGLPAYAARREQAVGDVGSAFEDRGMYRGGARMSEQAEVGREIDRERMDFEAGIRDQLAENQIINAMDIAELRRQLLEQGYSAAQANSIANAQAGL